MRLLDDRLSLEQENDQVLMLEPAPECNLSLCALNEIDENLEKMVPFEGKFRTMSAVLAPSVFSAFNLSTSFDTKLQRYLHLPLSKVELNNWPSHSNLWTIDHGAYG